MAESRVEWDVKLWTYVLIYKGEKYPLNVNDVREADSRARLKLHYLQRIENSNKENVNN
jgi:hypothetical protein